MSESLPDETSKCRSGNVFTLLVERILVMIVEMSEGIVNEYVMSFLRNALGFIGVDVNDICIPFSSKLCPSDPKMLEAMFGCSPDHKDAHTRCYCARALLLSCRVAHMASLRTRLWQYLKSAAPAEAETRAPRGLCRAMPERAGRKGMAEGAPGAPDAP